MDAASLRPLMGVLLAVVLAASANPLPLTWLGSTEVAKGRGERGPWRQNDSRYDFVDDPAVAIDDGGSAAVAWVDQAAKDVFFQRFSADGHGQLQKPVNVSRNPDTFSWLPRVVIAPAAPANVFVLWQEIIFSGGSHGGDILFARSEDGGRSFSQPINLSNSIGGDGKGRINREIWHNGSLDLAAGADGALYAAWTEYEGPLWFSRSSDGGKTFSRPARIAGGGRELPARAPTIALGPAGTLYLAWTVGEDEGADIRLSKSTDGGTAFSAPEMPAPSKAYSDAPKLAVDSAGVVHLAFSESAGGPFARHHIRYLRSTDGARSFEPSREISAPLPGASVSAAFPDLGLDATGNVYVLWESYDAAAQQPRGLGLAVSTDGGRTFATPAMVLASADAAGGFNGSSQGLLMKKLAVNRAGALAIVNASLRHGAHSRVWLMRGEMRR